MSDLRELGPLVLLRCILDGDPTATVELEIVAEANAHRVFARPGTRTRYGLPNTAGEVPRGDWMSQDSFFVAVAATRPNFGGIRLWFICPRASCGRRCAVLYRERQTNARAFTCFRCSRLAYTTQRLSRVDRMEYRAAKLAFRLDSSSDDVRTLRKPKWMRWRTFNRTIAMIAALDAQVQPIRSSQYARFRFLAGQLETEAIDEIRGALRNSQADARAKAPDPGRSDA